MRRADPTTVLLGGAAIGCVFGATVGACYAAEYQLGPWWGLGFMLAGALVFAPGILWAERRAEAADRRRNARWRSQRARPQG